MKLLPKKVFSAQFREEPELELRLFERETERLRWRDEEGWRDKGQEREGAQERFGGALNCFPMML